MKRYCLGVIILFYLLAFEGCAKEEASVEEIENGVLSVNYLDESGQALRRGVLIDGRLEGYSGEPMEVTPGHHVISLEGPVDYERPFEEVLVLVESPGSVTFRKSAPQ